MKYYRLNNNANADGTSLQDYVDAPCGLIAGLWGAPLDGDGFKVSTEWIFQNVDTGDVVTLYDYKMTHLYNASYMSVEDFRAEPLAEWHIGASNRIEALNFKEWFLWNINQVMDGLNARVKSNQKDHL